MLRRSTWDQVTRDSAVISQEFPRQRGRGCFPDRLPQRARVFADLCSRVRRLRVNLSLCNDGRLECAARNRSTDLVGRLTLARPNLPAKSRQTLFPRRTRFRRKGGKATEESEGFSSRTSSFPFRRNIHKIANTKRPLPRQFLLRSEIGRTYANKITLGSGSAESTFSRP